MLVLMTWGTIALAKWTWSSLSWLFATVSAWF